MRRTNPFVVCCVPALVVMQMIVQLHPSSTVAFTPPFVSRASPDSVLMTRKRRRTSLLVMASDKGDSFGDESTTNPQPPAVSEEPMVKSVVRVDDAGSDLTDRFKYKVQALMGVFDPQTGVDDERQDGNILNAMLKFPVRYSFHVVGKTKGDETLKQQYIDHVKEAVGSISGDADGMECRITPRGANFTRVTVQVTVDSVAVINSIYDALDDVELTVMRY